MQAQDTIEIAMINPYDEREPQHIGDWAEVAALGIFADLTDRRGIKHELENIDDETRQEIVAAAVAIIREAKRQSDEWA